MLDQGPSVTDGSVPLMLVEAIDRIGIMQCPHHAVACHFSDHTRSSDGPTAPIALDQRPLGSSVSWEW